MTKHTRSGTSTIGSTPPTISFDHDPNAPAYQTPAFATFYTTSTFPVNLTASADAHAHVAVLKDGGYSLDNPGGTVARMVDFPPGMPYFINHTRSLDYAVVVEGEMELVMEDSGMAVLRRGDVVVQRATRHGWRNKGFTE